MEASQEAAGQSRCEGLEHHKDRVFIRNAPPNLCFLNNLFHQHHGGLPECGFLAVRFQYGHLAVVFAGRQFVERDAKAQRHGFRLRMQTLRYGERGCFKCLCLAAEKATYATKGSVIIALFS